MRWVGHVALWGGQKGVQSFGGETGGNETAWKAQIYVEGNIAIFIDSIIHYFTAGWKGVILSFCVNLVLFEGILFIVHIYIICENLSTAVCTVGNSTTKRTNTNKCYTPQLIF